MTADGVTAVAAVVGVLIAFLGLKTWREQLYGNKDHEIAWKYLEAVFKLRNAINHEVRNPAIFPGEIQSAVEEFYGKNKLDEEKQKNPKADLLAVYSIRWKEVMKARKNLDNVIIHAEIWWGEKVVGLEKPINECLGTLFVNVKNYINPQKGMDLNWNDDVIYYEGDGSNNEFDQKLKSAVKKMEDFARPYLRKED